VTEQVLHGGDLNVVVRVGDTVRRPVGPWSPAVHALLEHFEQVGFDGAPRFLGIDEQGREILSYVDGEPGHAPVPADDGVVAALGRLLRRMHDAQEGFVPPADARWQRFPGETPDGELIVHDDLFWTNVVFRDGAPVALIDWDLARPATRLAEVARAASYWAPLITDDGARTWGLPTDRRGPRLRLLCDAYGLDDHERAGLIDEVARRRKLGYEAHRLWGGVERRPGWREMWDAGSAATFEANLRWLAEHREELESWLR
jgi:aminoglycoside phosphotransferase (APT) family kinase protein